MDSELRMNSRFRGDVSHHQLKVPESVSVGALRAELDTGTGYRSLPRRIVDVAFEDGPVDGGYPRRNALHARIEPGLHSRGSRANLRTQHLIGTGAQFQIERDVGVQGRATGADDMGLWRAPGALQCCLGIEKGAGFRVAHGQRQCRCRRR